jgi:hypothetical protein
MDRVIGIEYVQDRTARAEARVRHQDHLRAFRERCVRRGNLRRCAKPDGRCC